MVITNRVLEQRNIRGVPPKDIAEEYENNKEEWYNVTIDEDDLQTVASVDNLKWYAVCGCHSSNVDNVVKNWHVLALVRLSGTPTLKQYRSNKIQLYGKSLLSLRTVFRKIKCLDHVIGVLHYLACDSNRKPYRGEVTHSHYDRNHVFSTDWLHRRGGNTCIKIRNLISRASAEGVSDLSEYEYLTELHDFENCVCARGREAVRKRQSRLNTCSECGHGTTDTEKVS